MQRYDMQRHAMQRYTTCDMHRESCQAAMRCLALLYVSAQIPTRRSQGRYIQSPAPALRVSLLNSMDSSEHDFLVVENTDMVVTDSSGSQPLLPAQIQAIEDWIQPNTDNANSSEYKRHLTSCVRGTDSLLQDPISSTARLRRAGSSLAHSCPRSGEIRRRHPSSRVP